MGVTWPPHTRYRQVLNGASSPPTLNDSFTPQTYLRSESEPISSATGMRLFHTLASSSFSFWEIIAAREDRGFSQSTIPPKRNLYIVEKRRGGIFSPVWIKADCFRLVGYQPADRAGWRLSASACASQPTSMQARVCKRIIIFINCSIKTQIKWKYICCIYLYAFLVYILLKALCSRLNNLQHWHLSYCYCAYLFLFICLN